MVEGDIPRKDSRQPEPEPHASQGFRRAVDYINFISRHEPSPQALPDQPEEDEVAHTWSTPMSVDQAGNIIPEVRYRAAMRLNEDGEVSRVTLHRQQTTVTETFRRDERTAWVKHPNDTVAQYKFEQTTTFPPEQRSPEESTMPSGGAADLVRSMEFDEQVDRGAIEEGVQGIDANVGLFGILQSQYTRLGGIPVPEPREPGERERRPGPGTPHRDDVLDKPRSNDEPRRLIFGAGADVEESLDQSHEHGSAIGFTDGDGTIHPIFERDEDKDIPGDGLER